MIRQLLLFSVGATPGIVGLLFLQWRRYGSPLSSGYGPLDEFFALSNVAPNVRDYLGRLATGETAALTLAAASVGMLLIFRRRLSARRVGLGAAAVPASWFGALVLASYLAYGIFPDWSSLRFLLPVFPLAFVVVGALVVNAASTLPRAATGLVLSCLLAVVSCANVAMARREQAFNLNLNEERYRTAGRYLAAMLPDSAVIVALQQGGSARFYAKRPVVRWDLLAVDLDIAIERLRQLGRRPVFLVEEWEAAELQARFPLSRAARLDWPPRAVLGANANVRLFDPSDVGSTGLAVPVDRVR